MKTLTFILSLALTLPLISQEVAKEEDYYTITQLAPPEGVVLEAGSIEMMPGELVAVSSRRGEIYTITNAFKDSAAAPDWKLYAQGLHEVLGLSFANGHLYATQRPEITRLEDIDNDRRADVFHTLSSDWGINGDYHEYIFGSRPDKEGNLWAVLCLTGSGGASSDFRGWCVRITPDGKMIPTCSGVRSPGGIGENHLGDMFYCDNQGPWNGSSSLKHLKPGGFVGNPTGNKYYELTDEIGPRPPDPKSGSRIAIERDRIPELVPPACVLPHGAMGQSPAGIACDVSGGKFGPFQNQLFIAEQTKSCIQRVFLEKVNGVYQGACFPFRSGFGSGNVSVRFAPDGSLFTGGTNRGWGSVGRNNFALERLDWTGELPFEIHEMRAAPDGFTLTFTQEIDVATASDLASYTMDCYTYIYQSSYGSPVVDKTKPTVKSAKVSSDKKSVHLVIDGIVKGNVHELKLPGVKNNKGELLLHPIGYYTLNEIPSE
ncbi:MAG: glucose/arabinose dehydrogenase [Verrucomicrobiales bacterium]|jgi:glucose/arabinose dehydrogenase